MRNAASWTKVASLLFIDTPLFTGFSRSSDNVTDRSWGARKDLLGGKDGRPAPRRCAGLTYALVAVGAHWRGAARCKAASTFSGLSNLGLILISTRPQAWHQLNRPLLFPAPFGPLAGDENTTALHLASLLAFYERFPRFRDRPLFVTGHSYAGGQLRHNVQPCRRHA